MRPIAAVAHPFAAEYVKDWFTSQNFPPPPPRGHFICRPSAITRWPRSAIKGSAAALIILLTVVNYIGVLLARPRAEHFHRSPLT